ncbi:hypothetical protein M5J14_23710, partial [Lysinibacillus sp. OL1_EC]|nr:hypothetical protein [Lysinibacillus sp. OL1_EC]
KPKNLLNTLQTGLDIVGMVPVVGEVADGVNGIIYAARGDKVNAALSFGAMIPVVGNAATAGKWVNKGAKAAKGISESAQKANKGLLGNVKEKVNKQVSNVKTQIQARVDEVKQQLRQLRPPEMELAGAGVNVRRIEDTGTVGRNTTTPSPKPSNSQPPQNGSNKKPDENKGTGKNENGWDIPRGGGEIGGRRYSEHALERMAPNLIQVNVELEKRAIEKGLKPGTKEFEKFVDPRGVPPMVVEDTIRNVIPTPGNRPNTLKYDGEAATVITNTNGDVITVIPKGSKKK